MLRILGIWACLAGAVVPVRGQIEFTASDTRVPIGAAYTMDTVVLTGTIAEFGIDVGTAGAGRKYDLRPVFEQLADQGIVITAEVTGVALADTPAPDRFPGAAYALRNILSGPDGFISEVYVFVERTDQGDVALGAIDVNNSDVTPPVPATGLPMSLTFGDQWSQDDFALTTQLTPDLRLVGQQDSRFAVDGWGVLTTPAGQFDCLRLHQQATGSLRYEGQAIFEELGEFQTSVTVYSWLAKNLGTVALIIESTAEPVDGTVPAATTTQIMQLTSTSLVPTAVQAVSWGLAKRLATSF